MRSHNSSNGTPLNPPLFWLDNIFKELAQDTIILLSLRLSGNEFSLVSD